MKCKALNLIRFVFFLLPFVNSDIAISGEIYNATVTGVAISNGMISVRTDGGTTPVAQPGCATGSYPWVISASLTIDDANRMLSVLLTAKSTGSKIRLIGTGACTVSANKEDVEYLMFVDGRV